MRRALSLPIALLLGILAVSCDAGDEAQAPGPGPGGDPFAAAAAPAETPPGDWRVEARAASDRGARFLGSLAQDGKWAFSEERGPDLGITAICCYALLRAPGESRRDAMRPTLDWVAAQQREKDGAIVVDGLATYTTACAILALKASGDPKYEPVIARGVDFLKLIQVDAGEGVDESSETYGGVGYGGSGTTNMSTTQWALEAASDAGLAKDDDFYRKALVFLERSQNRSESNPRSYEQDGRTIESGNDGGGLYGPGSSKAGVQELPGGRFAFRSYGSMSYALLKSYLFCDLEPRDPRVRAVLGWISKNWELERNPGMENAPAEGGADPTQMGLYYYYLTIGRTLKVAEGRGAVKDGPLAGWRADLARAVVKRQRADGSWVNPEDRWWEGAPSLVTAYALLALSRCLE